MNRSRAGRSQGFLARNWPWTIAAGLLVIILVVSIIAGAGFGTNSGTQAEGDSGGEGAAAGDQQQEFDLSRRIDGDPTAAGEVDAPVVPIEFADYRCPFCGKFHRDTLGDLVDEYVEDARVRVEWRDAPDSGHPDLPRQVLIEHAQTAGAADMEKFEADLDNEDLHAQVQSDLEEAQRLGVTSVPTFAINDSVISGAQPADVFRETIEKELAEAGT